MKLENCKFLTDENIDSDIVVFLRNRGLDVFDVKEEGLFRATDSFLLDLATQSNRIIITLDSDFGTLIHRDKSTFLGIIYLRPGHFPAENHIETLITILNSNLELKPPFQIIAEWQQSGIKIRLRNSVIL